MPKKILIVDDEPDVIEMLSIRLKKSGYAVISASDESSCLAMIESEKPDLILLDVLLPGVGGFAICEHLKKNEATKHIPVIMLTALIGESAKTHSIESGAKYFLSKPYDPEDLMWVIEDSIKKGS